MDGYNFLICNTVKMNSRVLNIKGIKFTCVTFSIFEISGMFIFDL